MKNSQPLGSEQIDELLSTLANQHCRFVLEYFRDASEEVASVEDLTTAFIRKKLSGEKQTAIQFHHTALPKLEAVGIVEYDARSGAVRYRGHSQLEDWYDSIAEHEPERLVEGQ